MKNNSIEMHFKDKKGDSYSLVITPADIVFMDINGIQTGVMLHKNKCSKYEYATNLTIQFTVTARGVLNTINIKDNSPEFKGLINVCEYLKTNNAEFYKIVIAPANKSKKVFYLPPEQFAKHKSFKQTSDFYELCIVN